MIKLQASDAKAPIAFDFPTEPRHERSTGERGAKENISNDPKTAEDCAGVEVPGEYFKLSQRPLAKRDGKARRRGEFRAGYKKTISSRHRRGKKLN